MYELSVWKQPFSPTRNMIYDLKCWCLESFTRKTHDLRAIYAEQKGVVFSAVCVSANVCVSVCPLRKCKNHEMEIDVTRYKCV